MKNRTIAQSIIKQHDWKSGRIIVLTGARQTGKTTLVRQLYPEYKYLSIEDPVLRSQYTSLTAAQWESLYPKAILDEVQKEPVLIESIKSVYDQWSEPKYILPGSSQLLLLEKVKESLAGRCIIIETFPLTVPELRTNSWEEPIHLSLFQKMIREHETPIFLPSFTLDEEMAIKQKAWDHYVQFGGYPAVSDETMPDEEKFEWLRNYVKTYLERDIRDLASFRDLDPFIKLQQYLAENTASLVNASAIATRLGLSSKTVQRYLRYFELSYQSITLPAWSNNPSKRLSKMSKVHYLDNGVIQAVIQKRGGVTGSEYESLVVAEIYKQMKVFQSSGKLYHLRTHDGKEVDLILETSDYFYAFEIIKTSHVSSSDSKNLKNLESILNKPLKKAFILSNDHNTKTMGENIIAVNAAMFLG